MSDATPTDIERALTAERAALAGTLAALRDRLAPGSLMADGRAALRAEAGPMVARLDRAIRAQPVAAAVAGVALAALVLGRRTDPGTAEPTLAGTRFEALTRWEDEGGPPAPDPVAPDQDWLVEAQGLRKRARELLARIDDAARRGLAPAAELAAHRTAVLAALACDTAAALGRGLGDLTGAARDQAILARERLYRSRLAEAAGSAAADHPLATGLAVAGLGAVTACLFPQTETEDRLLGPLRDDLVDDARQALRDEVMRASDLARTLGQALRSDLRAAGQLVTPVTDNAPNLGRAFRH
jgi:hypothetical protein